jgi:hypothetical protein
MNRISGARAAAFWYDPASGESTSIGTFGTQGTMDFESPGDAQVLVLDDASRALPAPGAHDVSFRGIRPAPRAPHRSIHGVFPLR